MTLPRVNALYTHWKRHPRVEWLAAAYLKYKPPIDPSSIAPAPSEKQGTMADLMAMFGVTPGSTVTR